MIEESKITEVEDKIIDETLLKDKEITIILPTFFTITDEVYKSYGGLEPRTVAVAKYLAEEGAKVNVLAPKGSSLTGKNIKIYNGNYFCWNGRDPQPYLLEKDLVESNIEVLKRSDVILDDSVKGDTPVLIRFKKRIYRTIPIEDLEHELSISHLYNQYEIWTDSGWSEIKNIWRHKINGYLKRITTREGFLEVTPNHSLIRDNEIIYPENLEIGDLIDGCYCELPNDLSIDLDFAWLLGFFVAEGYAAKVKHKTCEGYIYVWELYNNDISLLEKSQKILEKFCLECEIKRFDNRVGLLKLSTPQNWAEYFRNLCYSIHGEKIIPNIIFRAQREAKIEFLKGYWKGDGHHDDANLENACESKSKSLIAGIALLLKNLGKDINIFAHKRRVKHDIYLALRLNKHNRNKKNPYQIKQLETLKVANTYVYDVETENNHFCAGVGNILCHNTHFGYARWLKMNDINGYPKLANSWDHHPDNLQTLPTNPQNIIAVSKWLMSELREKFKNQGHNFYHAYSGLIRDNYPSDLDFGEKESNLWFYIARFSTVKGPDIIIELAKQYKDDNFVLAGDCLFSNEAHYARTIKEVADSLDNVKVIFNISYKEKIDYLRRCTGLLHPGRWCLHPDETIMTDDSMVSIKNIKVGDLVLTSDGTYKPVLNVFSRHFDGSLIKVHPRYATPFLVTPEHKIKTVDGYKHAIDLREYDLLALGDAPRNDFEIESINLLNLVKFPNARLVKVRTLDGTNIIFRRYTSHIKKSYEYTSEQSKGHPFPEFLKIDDDFLHLCAVYIAEGFCEKDYVGFAIGKNEFSDIWSRISERLLCTCSIKDYDTWYNVSLHSRVYPQIFAAWFGKGAHNKKLPEWIWSLSLENKKIFLNYLINYDGHIETRTGLKCYSTVSKTLAYQIKLLALSIGLWCAVIKEASHYGTGISNHAKFYEGGYKLKFYESQQNYLVRQNGKIFVKIYKLGTEHYSGLVYDIEVAENHNFNLNSIEVSNSEPLGWDMLEGLYFGSKILAFDRGAVREIIKHEKHGFIVPFSDNDGNNIDLYKRAFRSFKSMKIDSEVCRQRILDNFDFKRLSYPVYREVLAGIENTNPPI